MRQCPQCSTQCDEAHKFCPVCGFPIGKLAQSARRPAHRAHAAGRLRHPRAGGRRRHGPRLSRRADGARPHGRGQDHPPAPRRRRERRRPLHHRGPRREPPEPPELGRRHRLRQDRDGQLYIVMEYLRGKDLARVALRGGALPFRRIVDIMRQVLAALGEAHHLDIIHRDLKPENIVLEPMRSGRRLRQGRRLRPRQDEGGGAGRPASPARASSAARPTT